MMQNRASFKMAEDVIIISDDEETEGYTVSSDQQFEEDLQHAIRLSLEDVSTRVAYPRVWPDAVFAA